MKRFYYLNILTLFCLLLFSCKGKTSQEESTSMDTEEEVLKTNTQTSKDYENLWKELTQLEKIHSSFISDFYKVLNQTQEAVKQRKSLDEIQKIRLPQTPKNWKGNLQAHEDNFPEFRTNLKNVEESFEEVIGLNHKFKEYLDTESYKKDNGKRIREIADLTGYQVEKHSMALDELQVGLENFSSNNLDFREQKVVKSEYLMAQQILSEMRAIVKTSYNPKDAVAYKKQFDEQYLNLKGILERAPIFPMPAPDQVHADFEKEVIGFLEKMEDIQKNFDAYKKAKSLEQKRETLQKRYNKAVSLYDKFAVGAQA